MTASLRCYVSTRTRQMLRVVRQAPFDNQTTEGRSHERYRRIAFSTLGVLFARGVSLLTMLISVQMTLGYLGTERYGMWMTISSIITILSLADLGVGNSLVNAITTAQGNENRTAEQSAVSNAFFMLSMIAAALLAFFAALYAVIPWPQIFNVTSPLAAREAGPAMAVFMACFAASIPLSLVQRVQVGHQEVYSNSLWQCAGNLLGLMALVVAIHLEYGLPGLVLAMAGAPLAATLFNWCVQFGWQRPWLLPCARYFAWPEIRCLAASGFLFFILQIFTVLGNSTDNLVIAQMQGASAVAPYAVAQKLFSIALLTQAFVVPLWPAFGDALARRDFAWAHRALNRCLLLSISSGAVIALPLLIFGKPIIAAWTGPSTVPSWSLLTGFAAWVLLVCYGGVLSSFLNSGPLVGRQTLFIAVAAIASLGLKFLFSTAWGISGVIWATVVGYGLLYTLPALRLAYGSCRQPTLAPN
jgi:O-antigen/teichoic acid export membrane protein